MLFLRGSERVDEARLMKAIAAQIMEFYLWVKLTLRWSVKVRGTLPTDTYSVFTLDHLSCDHFFSLPTE